MTNHQPILGVGWWTRQQEKLGRICRVDTLLSEAGLRLSYIG